MSTFDRALDAAAAAANDCKSKTLDGAPAPVAAYVDWTHSVSFDTHMRVPPTCALHAIYVAASGKAQAHQASWEAGHTLKLTC